MEERRYVGLIYINRTQQWLIETGNGKDHDESLRA